MSTGARREPDDFGKPVQDFVTEYGWGAVWGREGFDRKTRSMLNLAMLSILNRQHELRGHVRGALTNGVTKDEIREIFMHVGLYAGAPVMLDSVRIAKEDDRRPACGTRAQSLNNSRAAAPRTRFACAAGSASTRARQPAMSPILCG